MNDYGIICISHSAAPHGPHCLCSGIQSQSPTTCSLPRLQLPQSLLPPPGFNTFPKMSGHDHEDLIDYEDEHDIPNIGGAANGGTSADIDGKDKKNFSGIHSTGFR